MAYSKIQIYLSYNHFNLFIEKLLYTFHQEGELGGSLSNLKPLRDLPLMYIINIRLYIKEYVLEASSNLPCGSDTYQLCYLRERSSVNTSCYLPFENPVENITICTNDVDGYKTMIAVYNVTRFCQAESKKTCNVLEIEYFESPLSYGAFSINKQFRDGFFLTSNQQGAYIIHPPTKAQFISMTHNYGIISYIAEFAGWSGIFVGASIFGILGIVVTLISLDKDFNCCKHFLTSCKFVSIVVIFYITYINIQKYNDEPQGVTVDFGPSIVDFDMTICTTLYYHAYVRIINSTKSSYGIVNKVNKSEFWNEMKNISHLIDSIQITENGILKPLSLSNMTEYYHPFVVPSTYPTIDSCFTLDLSKLNISKAKSIILTYTAEIKIYLHAPGQFFFVWQDSKSTILTTSELIVKIPDLNQVIWHDLNVVTLRENYQGLKEEKIVRRIYYGILTQSSHKPSLDLSMQTHRNTEDILLLLYINSKYLTIYLSIYIISIHLSGILFIPLHIHNKNIFL